MPSAEAGSPSLADQWHIVTGEYPPQPGGLSDYSALVGAGLARAGADVHVWCPQGGDRSHDGVQVHGVAGAWHGADLARVDALLDRFEAPRRLFVQWVPHAYGRRSLNVGFCRWVARRARRGDRVELMVHEPFLAFRERSWRQDAAAAIHRVMAATLLKAASRVWVSIPAWAKQLRPWTFGRSLPFCWLPVPSTIPLSRQPDRIAAIRAELVPGELLIGHFGTYGADVAAPLARLTRGVLDGMPQARFVFLGRGSHPFVASAFGAGDRARVIALDDLSADAVSWHLQACDLLVQPYPDGVSTRRTTAMAALAHGRPMVTTTGRLSEGFWSRSAAISPAPSGDAVGLLDATLSLAGDASRRQRVGVAARTLYQERFDLARTIDALTTGRCVPAADAELSAAS